MLNNSQSKYNRIENQSSLHARAGFHNVFIGVCGYEKRSSKIITDIFNNNNMYEGIFGLIFQEYDGLKETIASISEYEKYTKNISKIPYNDMNRSMIAIADIINHEKKIGAHLSINIDISAMPRYLYCSLPNLFDSVLSDGDILTLWYVPGDYIESEFPTAGISQLQKFSGKASLRPHKKAHLVGLGFDSIRSEGILTVLDPKYLITFYSNPSITDEYTKRIVKDNNRILEKAKLVIPMNIFDCESCLSKMIAIVKALIEDYEVIIVPDGPKPFVLLSSIIPNILSYEGLMCLHIMSNRKDQKRFMDVTPIGNPIGISFS